MSEGRTWVTRARRVVVKVGSAVLTAGGVGLDRGRIGALAAELATLGREREQLVVLGDGQLGRWCGGSSSFA